MFNKKKMSVILGCAFVVLAFVSFTCSGAWASAAKKPLPRSMTIATLPKGTGNNTLGAAIAKVLTANLKISVTDRPSGGYARFVPKVDKGQMDMAVGHPSVPYYGYRGTWSFKGKPLFNIRQLAACNPLLSTWIASKKSGIKTFADFKGKRVAISKSLSGGAFYADTKIIWKYYGLDIEKDIKMVPIPSPSAGARALIEGRVDIGHVMAGTPIAQEAEIALGGLNWIFETPEQTKATAEEQIAAEILPDSLKCYEGLKGLPGKACFSTTGIAFMAHKDLDEEHAYIIVKTLWENIKDIQATHPGLKRWDRERAFVYPEADFGGIYHPGAIRFYKEVGKWTPEAEARNQWVIKKYEESKKKHGK